MSYHLREIQRGTLGMPSKIREELDELEDAIEQGVVIMVYAELADVYGALRSVAAGYGLDMADLAKMDAVTLRAFQSGRRT